MLLFYIPDGDALDPAQVAEHGLRAPAGETLTLYTEMRTLPDDPDRPIFVVDTEALDAPKRATAQAVAVTEVPPAALRNASPYRPPQRVEAGGGYVACPLPDDVAVLLIHRRGRWDLPKGKRDPGETLDACALREVREEVGISKLELLRPLGTTQHGYVEAGEAGDDGEVYAVKTTHWYLMQTPERTFRPERREGIRRVTWARWSVARRHIGYDTLHQHMDQVEPYVRGVVAEEESSPAGGRPQRRER